MTLVDTDVEVPVNRGATACCPSDLFVDDAYFTRPVPLSDDRGYPGLPTNAARYPWGGHCLDEAKTDCHTCNYCPYGSQDIQGAWVDEGPTGDAAAAGLFPSSFAEPTYGDVSNLIEIDGNTFRWRHKHRTTGHWADYRGFYYCTSAGVGWFVPTRIRRGEGQTCGLRYEMRGVPPNPREPYPDWEVGQSVRLGFGGNKADPPSIYSHLVVTGDPPYPYQVLCHPGEHIGPGGSYDCPDASVFFDCWDAAEPQDPPS